MGLVSYTVKRGDSLWSIAKDYASSISGNSLDAKIGTLVQINGIKNRNLIYVGQVLTLSSSGEESGGGGSSSVPSASYATRTKPWVDAFGLQAANDTSSKNRAMYASWAFERENTKSFKYRWLEYKNGKWVLTEERENDGYSSEYCYCEHSASDTATKVRFQVIPVPDTYEKKDSSGSTSEVPYWSGEEWSSLKEYDFSDNPPLTPPSPSVLIDDLTLTASISNIIASDLDAVGVKFNIVKDNSTSIHISSMVGINQDSNYVSYRYAVEPGFKYTVRACSVNSKGAESGWSNFSEEEGTRPSAPSQITKHRRNKRSDGSVSAYLEWAPVSNATKYKVEYTTVRSDFDTESTNIQSAETENSRTSIEIVGIESGYDYFFRVKAVNNVGESDPSPIAAIPIGTPPAAPTTWSSANAAFVGESMDLNWTHNPTDGSRQTYAQLSLKINDGEWLTYLIPNATDETSDETISEWPFTFGKAISYKGELHAELNTSYSYLKNAKIQWKVRTAGVTDSFSDTSWSVERTIYIYEKATLNLAMTRDLAGAGSLITRLRSLPFYIRASVSLTSYQLQKPVGYHLRIVSDGFYETVDDVGRTKVVNAGNTVYSKYFDTSETLIVEMSANNVDLENGIPYTVYCTVDMSTGLTIEQSHSFHVRWTDISYNISADVSVDKNAYTALITPYCFEKESTGAGGKNLLRYPYIETSKTINGVKFLDNGDGRIFANGTATAGILFYVKYWDANPCAAGSYCVSGCPSGGGDSTYRVSFEAKKGDVVVCSIRDSGSGAGFTAANGFDSVYYSIRIEPGVTVKNLVFAPQIELGTVPSSYEQYYENYVNGGLVENVLLSVYRREYDGGYTEIAKDVANASSITDPHPSLDYARYRLTAKDPSTGAISFYDMAGHYVGGSAIIIQWDEEWSTFDVYSSTSAESRPWTGSLLKLPYNVDVADDRGTQVSFVEYIGRQHPVSYYGTQTGEASSWSVSIPKEDKDTIYALRRLSLWAGDVYIREPSGMGYWANVNVTFSQKHTETTIPVTLSITRVEGGA